MPSFHKAELMACLDRGVATIAKQEHRPEIISQLTQVESYCTCSCNPIGPAGDRIPAK